MELRPFAFPEQRAPPSVHPPDKMEIPTLSHLSEFSFRPVFQKSSNRIFSKKKIRHFVTFLEKVQSHQLSYVTLSVIFSFFFASSLSINEQNKRHQLFTVDALWVTHYSLFTKLKFSSVRQIGIYLFLSCVNGSSIFDVISPYFTNNHIKFITIELWKKNISIINSYVHLCNIHFIYQWKCFFKQPIST